jgi:DNA-binding NtrC family response regulator
MDHAVQAKLLRFLQERTVQRVGASKSRSVDVRVVAATNRDLAARARTGLFREDLYYRLNVVPISVAPLRERPDDVLLLAGRFLQRFAVKYNKEIQGFTDEARELLTKHSWPGNVRQLENLVERLVILNNGPTIAADALPVEMRGPSPRVNVTDEWRAADADAVPEDGFRAIDQLEKEAIFTALRRTRGNVRDAARLLGLGQATVYRKIKRYHIVLEDRGRLPAAAPANAVEPNESRPGESA